uniref:Polysaccharide biosynthesis enzyme WcbI domain-containing protein n=1 Tax=viral metagenome TaxID=1070528 RepID=A0A6C0HFE3_9ZZZZ
MAHKAKLIREINRLNTENKFLIYENNASSKNLLIVSACRGSAFAWYFSQLTDYNIYMIYVITFISANGPIPDHEIIKDIVQKADIIVAENIARIVPFNTIDKTREDGFYKTFNVDFDRTKFCLIPNLELHYLSHDLFHKSHKPCTGEELLKNYNNSKQILFTKCELFNFHKTKSFIELHFQDLQLFHSPGHPSVILLLVLFVELCEHLGISVAFEDIEKCIKVNFLGGGDTPIFNLDVETFGLTYKVTIRDDSLFNDKDLISMVDPSHLQTYENAKLIYDFFNNLR